MSLCLTPDFVVWAEGALCLEGDCKGVFIKGPGVVYDLTSLYFQER